MSGAAGSAKRAKLTGAASPAMLMVEKLSAS